MLFKIVITPNAREDIRFFRVYEQRIITDGIKKYLTREASVETNQRKYLNLNTIAPWELRIDKYRVFYSVEEVTVKIVSFGYKDHNTLYIRGRKVDL
jgi:mRNA-degrading endonuclease RelE of RelBE toxin-antitoxin system